MSLVDKPIKCEHSEIVRSTLFFIQVCSEKSEEEALEWVRKVSPSGTSNNWMKSRRDEHEPVQCDDHLLRKHYMFAC